MNYDLGGSLGTLALAKHRKSRAINAENPTGEKAKGEWRRAPWDRQGKAARACGIYQAARL